MKQFPLLSCLALLALAVSGCQTAGPSRVPPPKPKPPETRPAEPEAVPAEKARPGEPPHAVLPDTSREPLRMAQVFRLPEPEQQNAFFAKLKAAGFNAVAVRAFQHPGDRWHGGAPGDIARPPQAGVYYESRLAPTVADLLPGVMERIHAQGMRAWAWMPTRGIAWNFPNRRDMLEYRYDFYERRIVPGEGLDIFNPGADAYLRSLFAEMAAALPLDGVLLQDDLVLRHDTGFGPHAEMASLQILGRGMRPSDLYASVDLSGPRPRVQYTEAFTKWKRFQSQRILELALSLRNEVRAQRPEAVFGMNVYYESVLMPDKALSWLAQDLESWRDSSMDYFAVMAYHRQIRSELELPSTVDVMARLAEMRRNAAFFFPGRQSSRLLWKIQGWDWQTREFLPEDELRAVQDALEQGRCGFAVAPVEADWPLLDSWRW